MDPLSITASVAGIAGLAIQIAPKLKSYFSDVKHAQEDVARYANEVYGLFEVCKQLHVFLKADAASSFETTGSVLSRTVVSCEDSLRKLAQILQSQGLEKPQWTKKVKWPIYKNQVEEIISRLVRYTQLFQFALTLEGWCVSCLLFCFCLCND